MDCVLVHISEYCHQLTAAARPSQANKGASDKAVDGASASSAAVAPGRMAGAAASAQQPLIRGATVAAGYPSCSLIEAASARQLAQRAFGELAAAATAAAARGYHFRRCQPLMMHLMTVSGAVQARLHVKMCVRTCRTHGCISSACSQRVIASVNNTCYGYFAAQSLAQFSRLSGVLYSNSSRIVWLKYAANCDFSLHHVIPVCKATLFSDAIRFVH